MGELARGAVFAERYQIDELLGRGGMGTVYSARDLSLGEPIALKVLSLGLDPPPVAILRFRQEVKLARRVTHPNVARVFDIGEHDGLLFLTMELLDGGTLRALMERERRLRPARAVEIGGAIAAGLAAAHKAGIVHRDLKPTNVLLDPGGRIAIADFGIARSASDEMSLTVGAIGTPRYMAPEQALGKPVDARADLYAFGRILYEMLTGDRSALADAPAERLRDADVPEALAALTAQCLELEPSARPASASEVERILAQALRDVGGGQSVSTASSGERDGRASTGTPPAANVTAPRRFEPPAPAERALAVLPFAYYGSGEDDYLGDVITGELVDVLSRNRGLRVLGTGATSTYRQARDARVIGRELGVCGVVDGSVQRAGARVRLNVRLIDAQSGAQLWSDHHEGTLEDLFAFQSAVARQIAEELRVEITAITHRGDAPPAAIEHYLNARNLLRSFDYRSAASAAAAFERCRELAPAFTPAYAGHAIAALRAWYFGGRAGATVDWEQAAVTSVARALDAAPELAETHLAAAMRATQYGNYPAAARALSQALAIAPTYAAAHAYLGMIECEASQSESGMERLRIATELDPELPYPVVMMARGHALHGRYPECVELLTRLERRGGTGTGPARLMRARTAAWRADRDVLRRIADDDVPTSIEGAELAQLYARATLGSLTPEEATRSLSALHGLGGNLRRLTSTAQLLAEAFAARGEVELAAAQIERAADVILFDLAWLDLCPILAPLRGRPDFAAARRRVCGRIDAILYT